MPAITPRVLVALPACDAAPWLERAARSILDQTLRDLRLLIVDDGSTDDSAAIADRVAAGDDRVVVRRQANSGPGAAMNRALGEAREQGIPYLARMDADDLSEPDRLRLQVERLADDPGIAACSANCHYIGEDDDVILGSSTVAVSSRGIARELRWGLRGLVQGATLFRVEALDQVGGYRPRFPLAEDTDLFLRLSERFRLVNRPEFLYRIRLRSTSLSLANFEANHLYAAYALDCARRRRAGTTELEFEVFRRTLSRFARWNLARELWTLRLWRRSQGRGGAAWIAPALLLDPRRVLARALRALERGGARSRAGAAP